MAETVAIYDFLSPPTQSGDLGTLAHYRVIDELGKGGMGYVFRAEDSKLQRSVALKVMNQKIAATSNSRQRFLHEARAMAAVHHDNVATIFEVGESDGTPFMAMEMLKGGTLETLNTDDDRLGYEKIIDYAQQTARGLSAAHVKGIVHRDIKPANIWIEECSDRIKILDFGLALASTPVDHLSGRGAVIGTPGYLSPEQARSEPLDDRSDLYSLGVVLYELATGQLPLQSGSVSGQLIAILAHRPPPIHELNPDIPKPLCDLIHRLLRKEPRMRPQSAAALDVELDQVREQCDATSEVAQAISKLQVGLTEVVSKSDAGPITDAIDDLSDAIHDPLSSIPSASSAAVGPASSGRFVVPGAHAQQNNTKAVGPNWKVYAPLLAVAAIIVTVLPATAFFFSKIDGATGPVVVTDLNIPRDANSALPAPGQARRDMEARNRQLIKEREQQRQAEERRAADEKQAAESQPDATAAESTVLAIAPSTVSVDVDDSDPPTAEMLEESKLDPTGTDPETPIASKDVAEPVNPSPEPESKAADASSAKPKAVDQSPKEPPAPEIIQKGISTASGRGADTKVRKGTTSNFGHLETIGIWKRGGVEVEHIYMRFDLVKQKAILKSITKVELILTVSGKRPIGGSIRLYGAKLEPRYMLWPERKVIWSGSPSDVGTDTSPHVTIEDFTVLATQEISKETDGQDEAQIRLSSAELTKFVAQSPIEAISFVLAGSAGETNKEVEFISSEGSKTAAPTLRIWFPKPPPHKPKEDKATKKPEANGAAAKNLSSEQSDRTKRKRVKRRR